MLQMRRQSKQLQQERSSQPGKMVPACRDQAAQDCTSVVLSILTNSSVLHQRVTGSCSKPSHTCLPSNRAYVHASAHQEGAASSLDGDAEAGSSSQEAGHSHEDLHKGRQLLPHKVYRKEGCQDCAHPGAHVGKAQPKGPDWCWVGLHNSITHTLSSLLRCNTDPAGEH